MRWLTFALLIVCFLAVCTVGCKGGNSGEDGLSASHKKLHVVATTCLIKDLVESIGGNRVEVEALVPFDVDPSRYKPTTADFEKIKNADLVFHNGLKWETGFQSALQDRRAKHESVRRVVAVAGGSPINKLDTLPNEKDSYDPHIWFNVTLWKYAIHTVRDALGDIEPTSRPIFEEKADACMQSLDDLDEYIRQTLRQLPNERRVAISGNTAMSYFATDYRLEFHQIPLTNSKEATSEVDKLADLIVARKIGAIFVDADQPMEMVDLLVKKAKERGAAVKVEKRVVFDMVGSPGTSEATYIGMMKQNVEFVVEALKE